MTEFHHIHAEPEKTKGIDSEFFAGGRFPYQESAAASADVDLEAGTPGDDINWLEDIEVLEEDGYPAVFDRYSNSFLKIYFDLPEDKAARNEIGRKILLKHLQSGGSYGIQLKSLHAKFPQPELGPWTEGSKIVGESYTPQVLEGWTAPAH